MFEYQPSRAKLHPKKFLKDFQGFLQTDGYAAYDGLKGVTNVGCWANAKRKHEDAIKAAGGKGKHSKTQDGLNYCKDLYIIEKELRELKPEERYQRCFLESKPKLEVFRHGFLRPKKKL